MVRRLILKENAIIEFETIRDQKNDLSLRYIFLLKYTQTPMAVWYISIYSITAPFQISMKLCTCSADGYNNKCQNIMLMI